MQGFEILGLPGLSLLLLQHGCDAGNERSGLLNDMVSNIDRNAARSTLGYVYESKHDRVQTNGS